LLLAWLAAWENTCPAGALAVKQSIPNRAKGNSFGSAGLQVGPELIWKSGTKAGGWRKKALSGQIKKPWGSPGGVPTDSEGILCRVCGGNVQREVFFVKLNLPYFWFNRLGELSIICSNLLFVRRLNLQVAKLKNI